jgi:hypothetical protein
MFYLNIENGFLPNQSTIFLEDFHHRNGSRADLKLSPGMSDSKTQFVCDDKNYLRVLL